MKSKRYFLTTLLVCFTAAHHATGDDPPAMPEQPLMSFTRASETNWDLDWQKVATTRSERATRFQCQGQTSFLLRELPKIDRSIFQTPQDKLRPLKVLFPPTSFRILGIFQPCG